MGTMFLRSHLMIDYGNSAQMAGGDRRMMLVLTKGLCSKVGSTYSFVQSSWRALLGNILETNYCGVA